jgi:hypothetical protein
MNLSDTPTPQMSNTFNTPNRQFTSPPTTVFSIQNVIIVFLLMIILLPALGISTDSLGKIIQQLVVVITGIISWVVSSIAFLTGNVLNTTTDVVSTTAKTGIDITDDTINSVGDLLIKASSRNNSSLDDSLNRGTPSQNQTTEPSNPENPIQKPISANKTNWCLVGEYQGKRGCVEVSDSNKCMSGQLFPSQSVCLNPNITTYKN